MVQFDDEGPGAIDRPQYPPADRAGRWRRALALRSVEWLFEPFEGPAPPPSGFDFAWLEPGWRDVMYEGQGEPFPSKRWGHELRDYFLLRCRPQR